ncbi:MAG: peptidase, partial [Candidatus Devosia euplotis]|nr:peptidase [Candidatus Devosia euplotis]
PAIVQAYVDKVKVSAKRRAHDAALKDKPSITRDGVAITLLHNSGLAADLPMLDDTGAAGVGLFRTELQFMIASKLPRLGEQTELYAEAMAIAGERPVVFRLLDIGGDKVLPYQRSMAEENPAMGFRSIRLGLARPGLLRTQIRALLLAANGRSLKILVPMVTETFEFVLTRKVMDKEVDRLRRAEQPVPSRLELGVMVEVPSLLFELDQLLPLADFVSIGSNDLVQFLTASDRANPRIAKNYDPIGMPRLRAVRLVVDAARRYNIPITMCGELAGKPLEALALMAVGMTRLSMGSASIGPIKELVLNLDLKPIQQSVNAALGDGANGISIRQLLQEWIERQNLPV